MQLQLGTALVLASVLASAMLVLDREHRTSPFVALGAALVQALLLFDAFDFLRSIWRIELILPTTQFVCAYTVWTEVKQKRAVTASTVLLAVTILELAMLFGRIRP